MQRITLTPLRTAAAANGTTTIGNPRDLPQDANSIEFLLNIQVGGVATGSMQIYIEDSVDGGVTWDDTVSSTVFVWGGAAAKQQYFCSGYGIPATITGAALTNRTQGSAPAAETLAAGSARQGPFGAQLRVREVITLFAAGTPCQYSIDMVVR